MKLRCIILDDEPMARKLLREYCSKVDFLDVMADFSNAIEASSFVNEQPVDLIFLDIKMPEITGLGFLSTLANPPKVIFTTAFAEYALDGFEHDAIDYLLKPFDFTRFLKAANKAKRLLMTSTNKSDRDQALFVKEGRDLVKLSLSSILYIQGQKDYVSFCTKARNVMSLMNMKDLEKDLASNGFLRIHQSYLINTQHITSISLEKVVIDKQTLPISQSYRNEVKRYLDSL